MATIELDAKVHWLSAADRGRRILPASLMYIGIGRFEEDGPSWPDGAWSVVCRFSEPPAEQGSPSTGRVSFLVEHAPHERLVPGRRFDLYEGPTRIAAVELFA
jgi:hypothetical protein